jgi:hypothetical protein
MTVENGYAVVKQSLIGRIWQRLGFKWAFIAYDDELEGAAPACIMSEITTVWDWRDRLRILVSGKSSVMIRTYTEVSVDILKVEVATGVIPPFQGRARR